MPRSDSAVTAGESTRYGWWVKEDGEEQKNKFAAVSGSTRRHLALGTVLLRQESKGAVALTRLTWLPLGACFPAQVIG